VGPAGMARRTAARGVRGMEVAAVAAMHRVLPNPHIEAPALSDAALAAQYDNNSAPRNAKDLAGLRALSAGAFAHLEGHEMHRFSADGDDWVDVFRPAGAAHPMPALVFAHGGRWRLNTSRETAFWAEACVRHGFAWVGINFPPLGKRGLAAIAARVERAIASVFAQAGMLGIDPAAIALGGHSSGAHLALSAAMAQGAWVGRLRALLLLGGMYDLRPLARSAPEGALGFTTDEAMASSPLLALEAMAADGRTPVLPAVLVGVGAEESAEFVRQARALHWRLRSLGVDSALHAIAGRAHFDAALEFNAPSSVMRGFVAARLLPGACRA
jgi:arylformamidase